MAKFASSIKAMLELRLALTQSTYRINKSLIEPKI